jgi:hypothetical protein
MALSRTATRSLAVFAAIAITSAALATPVSAAPGEVRIPVVTVDSSTLPGKNGTVLIKLGASKPFRVMLDTGSVGLRLFTEAPQVGLGKATTRTELPNGQNVRAVIGKAKISIGKTQTTQAISYQRIPSTNAWIDGWQDQDVLGILGIGLKSSTIPNPLRFLPGTQGLVWSVKFARTGVGSLIVGDEVPPSSIMHFPLPTDRQRPIGNPDKVWDDHAAPGCWTFRAPKRAIARENCVDTWFDSGFPIMRIKGAEFSGLKLTPTRALAAGTEVRLAPAGSAFAPVSFRAGDRGSRNTTRVVSKGRGLINTGNSYFFDYRVYYSVATGDIYLDRDVAEGQANR